MNGLILALFLVCASMSWMYVCLVLRVRKTRKALEVARLHNDLFTEILEAMEFLPPKSPEWKKFVPRCEEVDKLFAKTSLAQYRLADLVRVFAGELSVHEMRRHAMSPNSTATGK